MPYSDYTSEVIVARGEEIYQQFRDELESQYKGQFFVVDIKTEDYESLTRIWSLQNVCWPSILMLSLTVCKSALEPPIVSALEFRFGSNN
ncbi:hypothetical protein C6501_16560 [Candidatus Poribacteria bacterium]|nr:MAG: hypothetical protein C6501_16560 [Candidatus Poribacteria bacterium]